jgi:hypothetical protein
VLVREWPYVDKGAQDVHVVFHNINFTNAVQRLTRERYWRGLSPLLSR